MAMGRARSWLAGIWWIVTPPFAVLVGWLAFERTCGDPYELLPAITSRSELALPLAILYLVAHCWAVGAYLLTVCHAGSVLPSTRAGKQLWGRQWPKLIVMISVFAVEYAPMPVWRVVGSFLNCGS